MANWKDDFELASSYTDDTLAQQAASTASTAASEASAAKSDAASAKTTATTAASTASAADTKATQAASAAATADSKATEAATTANTAASTATQAKTAATTAQTKAEAADTKASTAATDAATAKTTAAGAASTASTAKTTADNAASTAATAKTTATTANTTANTAKTTAEGAATTAAAADTKATEAKETAVEAKETAEATAQYFMADSTGAYVASVEGNHDSGKNLKLSSDGLAVRDGVNDVATFGVDGTNLYTDKKITAQFGSTGMKLYADTVKDTHEQVARMEVEDRGGMQFLVMGSDDGYSATEIISGYEAIVRRRSSSDGFHSWIALQAPVGSEGKEVSGITLNVSNASSSPVVGLDLLYARESNTSSINIRKNNSVVADIMPISFTATWQSVTIVCTRWGKFCLVNISGCPTSSLAAWGISAGNFYGYYNSASMSLQSWITKYAKPAMRYQQWYTGYATPLKLTIEVSGATTLENSKAVGAGGDLGSAYMYPLA